MSFIRTTVLTLTGIVLGACAPGAQTPDMDPGAKAPGASVVLAAPLDTRVADGRVAARPIKTFKLTGRSDFVVPANSLIRGRYGITLSDQPDTVTLWIDWIHFDDLGPGASRNLGRHPAFFTLETLTSADMPDSGVLPAGTTVTLRYDALRDRSDSVDRSSHLVVE